MHNLPPQEYGEAYLNHSPAKMDGYRKETGLLRIYGISVPNIDYWVSEERDRKLALGDVTIPLIIIIKDLISAGVQIRHNRNKDVIIVFEDDWRKADEQQRKEIKDMQPQSDKREMLVMENDGRSLVEAAYLDITGLRGLPQTEYLGVDKMAMIRRMGPDLLVKPAMENVWLHLKEKSATESLTTTMEKFSYLEPRGYATDGSVGFDLPLQYDVELSNGAPTYIDLGFQCAVPYGYMLALVARSGAGAKYGVTPRNNIGIIDQDFRGNLGLIASVDQYGELSLLIASKPEDVQISRDAYQDYIRKEYKRGDCIAQAILIPIAQAWIKVTDELPTPEAVRERVGGFGSTGR